MARGNRWAPCSRSCLAAASWTSGGRPASRATEGRAGPAEGGQPLTGYIRGGVTVLGRKEALPRVRRRDHGAVRPGGRLRRRAQEPNSTESPGLHPGRRRHRRPPREALTPKPGGGTARDMDPPSHAPAARVRRGRRAFPTRILSASTPIKMRRVVYAGLDRSARVRRCRIVTSVT